MAGFLMRGFIIYYRDEEKVCGTTQAEWDAAPQDGVIGVTELHDGHPVLNIVGSDWYARGEKRGRIYYPHDKGQVPHSLAFLFEAIKRGAHVSTDEMKWMNDRMAEVMKGGCGCAEN